MGQMKCFLEKFELTFINKSKGDVRQQVLKRSFCLNYRFFPPGDNFNARSYSVGYNVIMAYSSAYIFKFFENCLFPTLEKDVNDDFFFLAKLRDCLFVYILHTYR